MDMKNSEAVLVSYEIKVPSRRSRPEKVQNSIDALIHKIKENEFIDLINVPEIIDESHKGKPFYRSVDVVSLGQKLQQATGKSIIVNKVICHLDGKDAFIHFLKEAKDIHGIQNLVLVGTTNSHYKYPGPSVTEANKIACGIGITVGNICIPTRDDEVNRMLAKTESGCSFFTTQMLFEDDKLKNVLLEYDRTCKEKPIQPARIFLSFSTVEDGYDIEFFKWLGVEIYQQTEEEMKKSEDMRECCADRIKTIYNSILKFKKENNISVPLGLNVAQVNIRNLDFSLKLTKDLSQVKV